MTESLQSILAEMRAHKNGDAFDSPSKLAERIERALAGIVYTDSSAAVAAPVDLSQFRDAVESWKRKRERNIRRYEEKGMFPHEAEVAKLAKANRLLALIDSAQGEG